MKQIYKKNLKRLTLIWFGCFILFLFGYILILGPQNQTKRMVERRWAQVEKKYSDAQKAAQIQNRDKKRQQIENLQTQLGDFAVDFEDSADLTFDISQMADEQNVTALSIKSKTGKPVADCKYLAENQIYLSFNAGFKQFFALLNAIERHRPVLFIDKFAITRSSKDLSDNEVSMELTVFVIKQKSTSNNSI